MRTYRESSGCATQRAWEVLDMGSAVITDEVEAAVKSPSSKWKQSLQRDKSSERHGNHGSQHNSTITSFLEPLAVIKSQHGKTAVSQEPALKWKRERWHYEYVWTSKCVMDWRNSEVETQYSMRHLENVTTMWHLRTSPDSEISVVKYVKHYTNYSCLSEIERRSAKHLQPTLMTQLQITSMQIRRTEKITN